MLFRRLKQSVVLLAECLHATFTRRAAAHKSQRYDIAVLLSVARCSIGVDQVVYQPCVELSYFGCALDGRLSILARPF